MAVFDGTTQLGTATADANGAWSFTTGTLANGAHSFTATDTDAAGNTSAASAALAVTVDTVAPNAPVIAGDTIINTNEVNLTGTAEANSTVTVYDGTTKLGTATADGNGAWSFTTGQLSSGTHAFTATATDAAGNTSAASQVVDPVINPQPPAIVAFSPDSGTLADGITNATTLTLTGTAAANSTITVYDGTTQLGTATSDGGGAWSFTTGTLMNGSHSFTATDTVSGATSAVSAALAVIVDTVAPAVTASLATDTGSSSTDKITANDTLTGSGDPNAVVHFTVDGKAIAGTATANASGVWSYTPTGLADGSHTIVASETDAAGNTGTASLTFTFDTIPPATTIADIVQKATSNSNSRNNTVTTTVSGTSDVGSVVTLYEGTKVLGTTAVNNSGQWSISLNNLSNTVHNFTAVATDAAGNTGALSQVAILGTTGSDKIAGVAGGDTIVGNGGADNFTAGAGNDTFVFNPRFGRDTVSKFDLNHDVLSFDPTLFANVASVLSHTHDVSGNAVITFDSADTVTLVGITTAQLSANQNAIQIIGAGPSAPAITSFSPNSGTAGDSITNATTLTLTGSAAANSTVTIYDGTTNLGTATANGSGAWSLTTGSLVNGSHSFTATGTVSGASSTMASAAFSVTVDTVAPNAPSITGESIVNANQMNLIGTAEANSTVTVYDGTTKLGTATANANGAWSFTTAKLSSRNPFVHSHRDRRRGQFQPSLAGRRSADCRATLDCLLLAG